MILGDVFTISAKMGWACFWAMFLQTHLVTLMAAVAGFQRYVVMNSCGGRGRGEFVHLAVFTSFAVDLNLF
jgi:hypothetical protein